MDDCGDGDSYSGEGGVERRNNRNGRYDGAAGLQSDDGSDGDNTLDSGEDGDDDGQYDGDDGGDTFGSGEDVGE